MRYSDAAYICDRVNDDGIVRLVDKLNEGYEILKFNTQWVNEGDGGRTMSPCFIAILVKPYIG